MKTLIYQNVDHIVIDVKKNLFIRSWDRSEVEIRFVENKKLEIDQDQGNVTISGNTHCMISAPESTDMLIEHAGGNCKVFGKFDNMTIEDIGGNLQIESIGNGLVERVGGNFYIGSVHHGLNVEKVGGNLNLASAMMPVQIEKVGGNLFVSGTLNDLACSTGGNINLFVEEVSGSNLSLRAGGNIHIGYKGTADVTITAKSAGGYNFQIGESVIKGHMGSIEKSFGSGSADWVLKAGANISILPVEKAPFSSVSFEDMDDAHWEEIAEKVQARNISNLDFSDFGEDFSEEIRMKTSGIENRVQKALEKFQQSGVWDISDSAINYRSAAKSASTPAPSKSSPAVSNEERMLILQMLQDKKITAEEADRLLSALEQ